MPSTIIQYLFTSIVLITYFRLVYPFLFSSLSSHIKFLIMYFSNVWLSLWHSDSVWAQSSIPGIFGSKLLWTIFTQFSASVIIYICFSQYLFRGSLLIFIFGTGSFVSFHRKTRKSYSYITYKISFILVNDDKTDFLSQFKLTSIQADTGASYK